MKYIKLIIIEDHTMVREMWKVLLSPLQGFEIVADCGTVTEARKILLEKNADVVLLDINLAGESGFDMLPEIQMYIPNVKVLGVSMHNILNYAKKFMRMGAMGYVTKSSTNQELIEAIRTVAAGKKYLCKEMRELLASDSLTEKTNQPDVNMLSKRELEIIEYLRKGKNSKEISDELDISIRTVEVHRYNILRKLHLKNTAALISFINKTEIGI